MLPLRRIVLINEEHRQQININRAEMRLLRDSSDPFQLTNEIFIDLYRLNKDLVLYLVNEIKPFLHQPQRITGINPTIKVLTALMFYATGSYQRTLGQAYLLSMSQQSTSKIVREVTEIIYENIAVNWIEFPRTEVDKLAIKRRFMEKTRFPGTIEEEHNYLNRKGFHSKNVQIICDYDLKFLSINARYAGAIHDSFILRNSTIQRELSTSFEQGDRSTWLLGDSGYPQQPSVMTPVLNPPPNSPSVRYNSRHAAARNCIERCNGVLKTRFRCIIGERKLRYNPEIVGKIVTACAVLHNMCVAANLELMDNVLPDLNEHLNVGDNIVHGDYNNGDVDYRQNLINLYFH